MTLPHLPPFLVFFSFLLISCFIYIQFIKAVYNKQIKRRNPFFKYHLTGDIAMKRKKIMLIINPCAGRRSGQKKAKKILNLFDELGADCRIYMTKKRGDATELVIQDGSKYDIVSCMGGDGTLNEVINGILKAGLDVPLGYIPAGSTNDFARSMHLSKKTEEAVRTIVECGTTAIDAGLFNDRYFSYVASFGIFTRTSYSTPQRVKNILGGKPSYLLHGVTELWKIHSEHMVVETNGRTYEGDFLFGAVTNSTSLGGVLQYDPALVDMSDGKLELMLIHKPKNAGQLFSVIKSLLTKKITGNPCIVFDRSDRFTLHPSAPSDWSLDGEFAYTAGTCDIRCFPLKINFICPQNYK